MNYEHTFFFEKTSACNILLLALKRARKLLLTKPLSMHWMEEGTNACSNWGQNQRETTFDGNAINLPPKQSEFIHIVKLFFVVTW